MNVKLNLKDSNLEFNGPKYNLTNKAKKEILNIIDKAIKNDYLLIMGSYGENDLEFIEELSRISQEKGINLVYDLSDKNLLKLLKYEPLFIKPNINELETIFEATINNDMDKIKNLILKLHKLGAKNISITMGEKGSLNFIDKTFYFVEPISITMVSPVGAGDSFVAGYVGADFKKLGPIERIKLATACASATASKFDLANLSEIEIKKRKFSYKKI